MKKTYQYAPNESVVATCVMTTYFSHDLDPRQQLRRPSRDNRRRDKGDTMKRHILVCTLAAGMAWAQSPTIIQNMRTQMNTVQQNKTAASNEALGIKQPAAKDSHVAVKSAATPAKPAPAWSRLVRRRRRLPSLQPRPRRRLTRLRLRPM